MIETSHFILYVEDQTRSTEFYSKLLDKRPILNVPGMTEFELSDKTILGLMPVSGIKKLLGDKISIPPQSESFVKSELYLLVEDVEVYVNRAKSLNATLLSEAKERDWGHRAAYFSDMDNHVIAFAEKINR